MEVSRGVIDAVLVPASALMVLAYHAYLVYKVKRCPLHTTVGINQKARRLWVYEMLIENHKKNVLAVQTLRNSIMESTLMATTAVLLTAGLATYFGFASALKPPLAASGNRGVSGSVKSMAILVCLMLSFLCHTQSIRFLNHVNYMVNIPLDATRHVITADYVADLLERGTVLYTLGSRSFYLAFPLLLWLFGSIPLFLCSLLLLHALYHVDFVHVAPHHNTSDLQAAAGAKKLSDHVVDVQVVCSKG